MSNPGDDPTAWKIAYAKVPFADPGGERKRSFGAAVLAVGEHATDEAQAGADEDADRDGQDGLQGTSHGSQAVCGIGSAMLDPTSAFST